MKPIRFLKQLAITAAFAISTVFGLTPAYANLSHGAEASPIGIPVFICVVDGSIVYFVFSREECDELGGVITNG